MHRTLSTAWRMGITPTSILRVLAVAQAMLTGDALGVMRIGVALAESDPL